MWIKWTWKKQVEVVNMQVCLSRVEALCLSKCAVSANLIRLR